MTVVDSHYVSSDAPGDSFSKKQFSSKRHAAIFRLGSVTLQDIATCVIVLCFFLPAGAYDLGIPHLFTLVGVVYCLSFAGDAIRILGKGVALRKVEKAYLVSLGVFALSLLFNHPLMGSDSASYWIYQKCFVFAAFAVFSSVQIALHGRKYLSIVAIVLGGILFLNLVLLLISPTGTNQCFVGHKNEIRNFAFPAFACAAILGARNESSGGPSCLPLVIGCLCLANFLVSGADTSLAVFLFVFLLYILPTVMKRRKGSDIRLWVACAACVFLGAVVLRNLDFASDVLQQLFEKDLTFNGRTTIWDAAISQIGSHPLLGVGMNTNLPWEVTHCHDAYLDAIYKGGAVYLVLWLSVIVLACKNLYAHRRDLHAYPIVICFGGMLLCGVFGELTSTGFCLCLVLAGRCDQMGIKGTEGSWEM